MRFSFMTPLLVLALAAAPAVHAADCSEDTAVQAMERAVKADPKNPTNNYNLASAYYNKRCSDQAIDAFERTLKLVKGDNDDAKSMRFECLSSLGGLYFSKGDAGEASKYFKQALDLRPSDKYSLNGISMALAKEGKREESLQYLKKTLLADPRSVEAHYRLAIMLNEDLEKQGKTPDEKLRTEVIEAFEKTGRLAEGSRGTEEMRVVCYTRLGELYRDSSQSEKAVSVLTKAIELAPKDFNSRFILGQMYYNVKNYAAMIEQYKAAVEIDPDQKLARFNLGVAYINQELYSDAFGQFKAIADKDPSDSEALALMGQTLDRAIDQTLAAGTGKFTAEQYAGAKADFEQVLSMDPKNKTAGEYLAKTDKEIEKLFGQHMAQAKKFLKAKKSEDAAEALEKALALKPDDEDAKALRSQTKANIGKLVARYIAAGEKAYKRQDFEAAETEWTKAAVFSEGKKKAGALLAKLRARTTTALSGSLKTAKAALKAKELVKARNAFRAALAADGRNAEAKNGLTQVNTLISDKVKKSVDKGRELFDGGDKKGAKGQFEAALKLDPTNADANSYIQRMTGSESNAKVSAERVKQLYYQGVDLYVNNKIKEAISTWKELLKLDPGHQDAQKNISRAESKLRALANL
jgi:tetratricopeptide (TPR) repeat protein